MPYAPRNPIDDFPGPKEVKALLREAVAAVNRGKPFNKVIKVKWEGSTKHIFVRAVYRGSTPVYLEFGDDHGHLLSESRTSELKKIPGLALNTQEVWATIPLALNG